MSQGQFILVLILQVAMPIILTVCIKYLSSYSSKKGENLAIIEDNQKIISGIESIKLEFAKLQELDRIEKNLISQRLITHDSQKDDLIFQLFEESSQLFNELRNPDPKSVGYYKSNQIAWVDYIKNVNNLISSIITKRAKLSVFFCKDDEILSSADNLMSPLIRATTALIKVDEKVSSMQSGLLKELVYAEVNGEIKVNDSEKMGNYISNIHEWLIDQVKFVYSLQAEFENAKQYYLSKVQSYYEFLRGQFNVR